MATGGDVLRVLTARPVGISMRTSCTALSAMFAVVAALLVASAAGAADDPVRVDAQRAVAVVAAVAAAVVLLAWRWMPVWSFFALHIVISAALGLAVGVVPTPVAALALSSLFVVLLVESFFVLSWAEAGLELVLGLGAMAWGLAQHPGIDAADSTLLVGVVGAACAVAGGLVRAVDRADLDQLTGLPNRRGVQRRGEALAQRAQRRGRPVLVALVDLDHFKGVNDTLGHAVGDELLRTVARLAGRAAPAGAVVGRWGGDEFVVAVATGEPGELLAVIDAVRAGLPPQRSLSAGVAAWEPGADLRDAVAHADEALYEAKRGGRGVTHVHAGAAAPTVGT